MKKIERRILRKILTVKKVLKELKIQVVKKERSKMPKKAVQR
jgi:hypothetical protein